MSLPVASIVVPSFRGVQRIPLLFDSLAHQTQDSPTFEVIVVVDGVDDGTVALIESETRFPVRAIVFPENRGRVAALNAGFHEAKGEILIRCDDDLVPSPNYVLKHVEAHAEARVGVIGMYLNVYPDTPYSKHYGTKADIRMREMAAKATEKESWRFWAGNCSIDRETWNNIGNYDPTYRLYGWEDVDYGYRLYKSGVSIIIPEELATVHRVAATTTASRARRSAYAAAARRIFESKFPEAPLPPAIPQWSLWNGMVRVLARAIGVVGPARLGGMVDKLLAILPHVCAEKAIAMTVEASAVAGYRDAAKIKEIF